jgi:hypothetical protein
MPPAPSVNGYLTLWLSNVAPGFALTVRNRVLDYRPESSPQSGEMFIATRISSVRSASSEMLGISLDAAEQRPVLFL